jgi:hypothetical protein
MKIVDADKFMEEICTHCDSHIEMCDGCLFKDIINNAQEEIVKCKDCRYWWANGDYSKNYMCVCDRADFFCPDGEKMDEEHDEQNLTCFECKYFLEDNLGQGTGYCAKIQRGILADGFVEKKGEQTDEQTN